MKNWKSTMAFFIFVAVYIYTAIVKEAGVVETTGFVALMSSLFMMLRSEMTSDIVTKLVDTIGKRFEK
jgi:hypothetical protein